MGNCCSPGDHPNPAKNPIEPPLETEHREYDPDDHRSEAMASTTTATNTPFLRTPDTMTMESEMEMSFLLQKTLAKDHPTRMSSPLREEAKKQLLLNPRLVSLLEFFNHLYVRKKDLFRRVISVNREKVLEELKKVGEVEDRIERPRNQVMQRSRSLGDGQELRNEKFKVKTFKPDEGQPPGGLGGTGGSGTKPGGGSK